MRKSIIIFITLLLSAALIYLLYPELKKLNEERTVFVIENTDQELKNNAGDISVLILGQVGEGQGGKWHFSPDLTDTIVLAYYREESGVLNLISLPRDLYGEFGGEQFKLNEVYRRNKIVDLLGKIPEISGITVEKYIVIDVGIIEKIVDGLGGIDVELDATITDPITGYKLGSGVHHLGGEDTVWLIRNRYAPEGDFFREKNQHVVIKSIFNKFNLLTKQEKMQFLLKLVPESDRVESNFSLGALAPQFNNIEEVNFNSILLDFSTGLLESSYIPIDASSSMYILIPKEGINNYSLIREFITKNIE
jgi:LCP family protein required for cell wall assembly